MRDVDWRDVRAAPTPGTKGAWHELAGMTDRDAHGFFLLTDGLPIDARMAGDRVAVSWRRAEQEVGSYLVDIAVGPAAAEAIVAPDLLIDRASGEIAVPTAVPKGTRLSARIRTPVASGLVRMAVKLWA